jgi:transposase-like protein
MSGRSKKQYTMSRQERQNRYFSEEIKRKLVDEWDKKLITLAEICREYEVTDTSVYKWREKYSLMGKKKQKLVVEPESDTRKIQQLREKIKELERMVGQKQIKIDFLEKMIDLTEEDLGIDIKKKGNT